MKKSTLLIFILIHSIFLISNAQDLPQSSLLKVGISPEWMPLQESDEIAFQIGLENSTKLHFITNEVVAGYMHKNNDLYYLKFDYKFYPLAAIFKNYRYQGIYLGFGPGIYMREYTYQPNDLGIALFASCGFQFFVNNRFSVSADIEFNSVRQQDPFTEVVPTGIPHRPDPFTRPDQPFPQQIADDFHITSSLKIGYLFNRPNSRRTVKLYD